MPDNIFSSPLFGITISILSFMIGTYISKKTKMAVFNPLLISIILIIAFLSIFRIPLSSYNEGGRIINMFLTPATSVLAITIYRQKKLIRENLVPILAGTIAGSISSVLMIYFIGNILSLDSRITISIIPKSITTPLALALSKSLDGISAITVFAVIITGISGNILAPILIKVFRFKNEVAQGIAIGTSSHAIGTSKAIELGEVQGAISSVALTLSGIITVIFVLLFF